MSSRRKLSQLSAFARPEAHLTTQTYHGAAVTVLGVVLACALLVHEVSSYFSMSNVTKMAVDLQRRHDLQIHVDVSFLAIPCAAISVELMDVSGTASSDTNFGLGTHLHKIRLGADGRRKDWNEYKTPQTQITEERAFGQTVRAVNLGAAIQHMNEMEAEVAAHEGCRVRGDLRARRVAGRVHFAVHQDNFLDMLPQMLTGHHLQHLYNMSHVIHHVTFGPVFPGQVNPLDGFSRIQRDAADQRAYKYFVKVVPTIYRTRLGFTTETSQYSVQEYSLPVQGAASQLQQPQGLTGAAAGAGPGSTAKHAMHLQPFVDLLYDISPIVVTVNQSPASLLHFLVRLCAVVGGAFAVTSAIDRLVHAFVTSLESWLGHGAHQPLH